MIESEELEFQLDREKAIKDELSKLRTSFLEQPNKTPEYVEKMKNSIESYSDEFKELQTILVMRDSDFESAVVDEFVSLRDKFLAEIEDFEKNGSKKVQQTPSSDDLKKSVLKQQKDIMGKLNELREKFQQKDKKTVEYVQEVRNSVGNCVEEFKKHQENLTTITANDPDFESSVVDDFVCLRDRLYNFQSEIQIFEEKANQEALNTKKIETLLTEQKKIVDTLTKLKESDSKSESRTVDYFQGVKKSIEFHSERFKELQEDLITLTANDPDFEYSILDEFVSLRDHFLAEIRNFEEKANQEAQIIKEVETLLTQQEEIVETLTKFKRSFRKTESKTMDYLQEVKKSIETHSENFKELQEELLIIAIQIPDFESSVVDEFVCLRDKFLTEIQRYENEAQEKPSENSNSEEIADLLKQQEDIVTRLREMREKFKSAETKTLDHVAELKNSIESQFEDFKELQATLMILTCKDLNFESAVIDEFMGLRDKFQSEIVEFENKEKEPISETIDLSLEDVVNEVEENSNGKEAESSNQKETVTDETKEEIESILSQQKDIKDELFRLREKFIKTNRKIPKYLEQIKKTVETHSDEFKELQSALIFLTADTLDFNSNLIDEFVSLRDEFQLHIENYEKQQTDEASEKLADCNKKAHEIEQQIAKLFITFGEIAKSDQLNIFTFTGTKQKFKKLIAELIQQFEEISKLKGVDSMANDLQKSVENVKRKFEEISRDAEKILKINGSQKTVIDVSGDVPVIEIDDDEDEVVPVEEPAPITSSPSVRNFKIVLSKMSQSEIEEATKENSEKEEKPTGFEILMKFLDDAKISCRICSEISSNLIDTKKIHRQGKPVSELIEFCTGINLSSESYLSHSVCIDCLKKIEEFYSFKMLAVQTNEEKKSTFEQVLMGVSKNREVRKEPEIIRKRRLESPERKSPEPAPVENVSRVDSDEEEDSLLVEVSSISSDQLSRRSKQRRRSNSSSVEEENRHKCPYCTEQFPVVRLALEHMQEHIGPDQRYTCTVKNCSYSQRNPHIVYYHIKKHNVTTRSPAASNSPRESTSAAPAPKRRKSVASTAASSNAKRLSTINFNQCPFCKTKTVTQREILDHYEEHKVDGRLTCKICDFQTAYDLTFFYHYKGHLENYTAKCSACDFVCYDSSTYSKHKAIDHHNEEGVTAIVTTSPNNALNHTTGKSGNPGVKAFCLVCKALITSSKLMLIHLEEKHKKGGEFKCRNCQEYKTGSALLFQRHMKECSTSCKRCGKKLSETRIFVDHLNSHIKPAARKIANKIKCKFCDKFLAPESLEYHVKYKHASKYKTYLSPTRGRGRPRKDFKPAKKIIKKAKSFDQVHHNCKTATCYYCNKVFLSLPRMFEHLDQMHKDESDDKFHCIYPDCHSKCSNSRSLYTHILKHIKDIEIKEEEERNSQ